nr:hypothetical protein BaRGS_021833 [Batillaria attramentaria]
MRWNFAAACSMKVFIVLVVYVTVGLQLTVIAMERWRKIVHPTWTQFNISVGRIISTPIVVGAMVLNMPSYMLFIPRDMIYIKYSGDGDFKYIRIWQCFPSSRGEEQKLLTIYVVALVTVFLIVFLFCGFFYASLMFHWHRGEGGPLKGVKGTSAVTYRFVHFLMLVRDLVTVEGRPFTSVANKVAYDVLDHTILVYYMAPFPVFLCFSGRQVVRMASCHDGSVVGWSTGCRRVFIGFSAGQASC